MAHDDVSDVADYIAKAKALNVDIPKHEVIGN